QANWQAEHVADFQIVGQCCASKSYSVRVRWNEFLVLPLSIRIAHLLHLNDLDRRKVLPFEEANSLQNLLHRKMIFTDHTVDLHRTRWDPNSVFDAEFRVTNNSVRLLRVVESNS
ncbi:hypothetical protein CpipJ_CPIJ015143, partial [Culex quinquefasciatus]